MNFAPRAYGCRGSWSRLKLFDKRTAQVLFTALAFALTLLFIYFAWRALIAFLFAVFFAYLLEAPVSRFQTWLRGSRPAAIAVVYVIFIGVLVLVFFLLGPPIAQEAEKLTQQAPEWANQITSRKIAEQVGTHYNWSQATIIRVGDFLTEHKPEMITATQSMVVRAARSLQNTWWLFLVPILAIFFLKDGNKFGQIIVNWFEDGRDREMVSSAVEQMHTMVGHYIRSQLLLAVIAMVVITLSLSLMRVPYAAALGPAAGAMEFIPVVGPIVGGVVIFAVAFLSGYSHLLWLCVFLLVWRMVQDYVISPRIMSGTLELHPLAVLFGVLAGGEVAGVIGVFLSIPVMATLRILWHTWRLYRKPSPAEPKEELV
jgi:predicted PurR-regulated permease PerM